MLNLRVIDTGTRTLPSDLKDLPFSDQRVIDRLNRLIDETEGIDVRVFPH